MNIMHWSFWLGSVAFVAAVWLSANWLVLNNLSGGVVRKLEVRDRGLSERLEYWLSRREEYRVLLRLLLVLDYCLLTICIAVNWRVRGGDASAWYWVVPGFGGLLFFVFTEAVGRHLPTSASCRLLAVSLPLIRVVWWLFLPLTGLLFLTQRRVREWREARAEAEERATAEDEIMSLVEQDEADGNGDASLEDDERRMIRGIFDLDETLVHEIMTPRVDVHGIENNAGIEEVKARIIESGHSRIPVYRDTIDHIVGVVYAKDLLDDSRVNDCASLADIQHRPMFIPETKNIGDLLQEFQQARTHFAIVLDEYGGTAGIVTFEDILEEIVGEIQDEYDVNEVQPTTEPLPDGSMVVDARLTVQEINEAVGVTLPEDDEYDTLGGYISAAAGRIPQAGETLETEEVRMEIVSADPRRVLKVRITRREEAFPGNDD